MAIEYVSELGDKLSNNSTAANLPKHIKVISAPNYQRTDNGVVTNPSLQTALDSKAASIHSHGNITSDGKVGTTANKPLITTTGGAVTTGSFGTSANTFCQGNDSRLSDARTPTAHASTATTYGVGSNTNYGHVKLYDNITGSNTDGAPTQKAVKEAVASSVKRSEQSAVGNAYKPVFVNSNGSVEECAYKSWDQNRNDIGYDALEPRFVKSSASGYFPAMTAGDAFYFRIDVGSSIGARYFFGCEFNTMPCHISVRANLFSYGYPVVVVDEFAGYYGGDYGIRDVIVRRASTGGKYELYIKVVSNVTKAADQLRWFLGSTQTTTSATLYTAAEYDALSTEVLFTVRARYYSLAVSNKLFYRDKVMPYGSGGSSSTPVFVTSDGEVKPCGDLTAEYANKVTRQNMAANASYTVPVIDGNGVVRTDTGTPQKLNYTSADNKLNVNIGGSSESTYKLIPSNMTSSATYRVPVMDGDGKVYKDSDQSDPKLTYKLSTNMLHTNIDGRSASTDSLIPQTFSNGTSKIVAAYDSSTGKVYNGPAVEKNNGVYKVYADISGNAATATNASSVNGMKIVRGTYVGVANTIYFC